jgi:hypothetical protein
MRVTQHADADESGSQRLPQKLGAAVCEKLCQRDILMSAGECIIGFDNFCHYQQKSSTHKDSS